MPLPDAYTWSVVFLTAPRRLEDGTWRDTPVGTGFIVTVPSAIPQTLHPYVVTAKHIVNNQEKVSVRMRMKAGGLVDVPVPDWICHQDADVAIARLALPVPAAELHLAPLKESQFVDVGGGDGFEPHLGDNVYFIGLLALIPAMADSNIPMVRSGTLGAKYQKDVPVMLPDRTRIFMKAHLIDCRAYRGFSGSPCFIQFFLEDDQGWSTVRRTLLLGLVSAHFDMSDSAPLEGDLVIGRRRSVAVPIHSGVGVVVPVEYIRDLLYDEVLVTERDLTDAKSMPNNPSQPTGTMTEPATD